MAEVICSLQGFECDVLVAFLPGSLCVSWMLHLALLNPIFQAVTCPLGCRVGCSGLFYIWKHRIW